MSADAAERAQRLEVALVIWNSGRTGHAEFSREAASFLNALPDEDFALWTECAALEAELRTKERQAAERFASLMNEPAGCAMYEALLELGWLGTPPSEE